MSTTRAPKQPRPCGSKEQVIVIEENGALSFVYDDALAALLSEGEASVQRASHVEPEQTKNGVQWFADMAPSGGPRLEGFATREAALAAEVNWLYANRL